jgi:hypothetical protein
MTSVLLLLNPNPIQFLDLNILCYLFLQAVLISLDPADYSILVSAEVFSLYFASDLMTDYDYSFKDHQSLYPMEFFNSLPLPR